MRGGYASLVPCRRRRANVGACGGDSPTTPTPAPTVSSVVVAQQDSNQTIFIGQDVQFTAQSTLSDGQMQAASGT